MARVATRYRTILSYPGARAFAFAGLLARLPISTFNLSVILLVEIQYDRWEVSGRVAAIGVVVWALQTLPTARWIDRRGQRMMIPLTMVFLVGVVILVATAMSRGPEPLLWLGTGIASLTGPLGSLTRARWSHLLTDDDEIHTAFSLEGALDEVLFVAGPALVTFLAYAVHPASGIVIAAVGMTLGITILLSRRDTEPPARHGTGVGGLGLKVPRSVIAVALGAIALGTMFGALDISTVAFAQASGHEHLGGVIIGILSFGSFVGGLAYGARSWRTPLWRRLVIVAVLLGVSFAVMAQMPNLWAYTAVGFIAGLTIAPTLTSQDSVTQRVVAKEHLTEGMSWLRIGVGAGVALGAWLGGRLIDTEGYRAGLSVMAWAAIGVGVFAIAGAYWVRRDTEAALARRGLREGDEHDAPPPSEAGEAYVEQPPTAPNI